MGSTHAHPDYCISFEFEVATIIDPCNGLDTGPMFAAFFQHFALALLMQTKTSLNSAFYKHGGIGSMRGKWKQGYHLGAICFKDKCWFMYRTMSIGDCSYSWTALLGQLLPAANERDSYVQDQKYANTIAQT